MCAASVYPEPGSNSLVCCIYNLSVYISFFLEFSNSFLIFSLGFLQIIWFVRIFLKFFTHLKNFIVYFSMCFVLFFYVEFHVENVHYCTTCFLCCQHFFKNIFYFFKVLLRRKKISNFSCLKCLILCPEYY